MKYLLFFLLFSTQLEAQPHSLKSRLKAIEGQYQLNNSGSPVYSKIIESDYGKDQLYANALRYLQSAFSVEENSISVMDGSEILCTGVFHELLRGYFNLDYVDFDGFYTLRIECKDKRARLTLTLTDWRMNYIKTVKEDVRLFRVAEQPPFVKAIQGKMNFSNCFLRAHKLALKTLTQTEAALLAAPEKDW